MKMSSTLKSLVIAAALAVAGSASAAILPPVVIDAETLPSGPSGHLVQGVTGDLFSYTFTFNVNSPSSFSGYVYSEDIYFGLIKAVTFNSVSLTGNELVSFLATPSSGTGYNRVDFSASNLANGAYGLIGQGSLASPFGGSFVVQGNLAPVPEPESYAMFLAGLGIIGAMARRKRA